MINGRRDKLRFLSLIFAMICLVQVPFAQGWIREFGGPANQSIYDFIQTDDGGYLFVGGAEFLEPDDGRIWVGRTNVHRQLVWDTIYNYYPGPVGPTRDLIQPLSNGNFRVLAADLSSFEATLLDITPQGQLDTAILLQNTGDSPLSVTGLVPIGSDSTAVLRDFAGQPVVVGVDANGGELWRTTLGGVPVEEEDNVGAYDILENGNGTQYVLIRNFISGVLTVQLVAINQQGVIISDTVLPDSINFSPRGMALTPDGGLVITGFGSYATDFYVSVLKLDANLSVSWRHEYLQTSDIFELPSSYGVDVADNGQIFITGTIGPGNNLYDLFVLSIEEDGTESWNKVFDFHGLLDFGIQIKALDNGDVMLCGRTANPVTNGEGLLLSLNGITGDYYTHVLRGRVALDEDENCIIESTDTPYPGMPVSAEGLYETYYTLTDTTGYFEMLIDTGNYVLSINEPSAWVACQDDVSVSINTFYDTTTVDFALEAQYDCTEMSTQVGVPFLRNCDTTNYVVSYCNYGTIAADSAYIDLFIDTNMVFLSSSFPLTSVDSNRYQFQLGMVDVLECGDFTVTVATPCDVDLLGAFFCVSSFIYPEEDCGGEVYTGPIVELNGNCEMDSIHFIMTNIGGDMIDLQEYIVIEDNIILMEGELNLGADESESVKVPSTNGAIYHLLAAQASDLPATLGNPIATFSVAACEGPFEWGDFSAFPLNDASGSVDADCSELIGAYDPNDKLAYPTGWQEQHYIDRSTELDYKIRFQNTGTDTAFNVVITDTLSQYLDPSSIELGLSSHDYRVELLGNGILRFTFSNIMLPDSNVNEAASHGFIQFSIKQKTELPYETVIENFADIYFDFNPPIRTNTTFHTIQPPLVDVLSSVSEVQHIERLHAYPNPAREQLTVELSGAYQGGGKYEVLDMQGRRLLSNSFNGNRFLMQLGSLPKGIYHIRLFNEHQQLGVVRIMVQ